MYLVLDFLAASFCVIMSGRGVGRGGRQGGKPEEDVPCLSGWGDVDLPHSR